MLIKKYICQTYKILNWDCTVDGLQIVKFEHNITKYSFAIANLYLVPEQSVYTNTSEFFNHLIPQIYILSDVDEVYLVGDFNARTVDLKDYIEGVDDMKPRYNVDKIRNNQGIELTKFLKDTRMHIANGRIDGNNGLCTKYDAQDLEIPSADYTFYSRSGCTSAIDYVISSLSGLEK